MLLHGLRMVAKSMAHVLLGVDAGRGGLSGPLGEPTALPQTLSSWMLKKGAASHREGMQREVEGREKGKARCVEPNKLGSEC
jgi:hypothetical protein